MAAPQPTIETRRAQMFPVLEHAELERVRRFGEVRAFAAGEALAKVGERGHGLIIVLAGKVEITPNATNRIAARISSLMGQVSSPVSSPN
jgi:thioredoxin reductase (NADPH)